MNWTQPLCLYCWRFKEGDRLPTTMLNAPDEICCVCGHNTREGIYIRIDPRTVRYADIIPASRKASVAIDREINGL